MTVQPWEPRLGRVEGAYEQVADRLNGIDRRLESLEGKVDDVRSDILSTQWRTIAFGFGSWLTIMAAILLRH